MNSGRKTNDQEIDRGKKDEKQAKKGQKNKSEREIES